MGLDHPTTARPQRSQLSEHQSALRAITPDGLCYEYIIADILDENDPTLPAGTRPWSAHELRWCHRDLTTGLAEPLEDWPPAAVDEQRISRNRWTHSRNGPRLTQDLRQINMYRNEVVSTTYAAALNGSAQEIDFPRIGLPLDSARSGRAVQWSPGGDFLLANQWDPIRCRILRFDVDTGAMRTFGEDLESLLLQGSASVTPDGSRCLVHDRHGRNQKASFDFAILILDTGDLTTIDHLLSPSQGPNHIPLGFATDTGLITQTHAGRRTHLHYLDLDTGYPHHLLDLPARSGNQGIIELASTVIQRNVATLG